MYTDIKVRRSVLSGLHVQYCYHSAVHHPYAHDHVAEYNLHNLAIQLGTMAQTRPAFLEAVVPS
jgi:hypothetical protein